MKPVERARRLHELCQDLLTDMEVIRAHGTLTDHLVAIDTVVALVNKSLYSLTISQEMLDQIDDTLNQPYQTLVPAAEHIVPLFGTAYRVLWRFSHVVQRWC